MNNNIFYYEISRKPIFYIIGITVSMWKQHNFETIFTSDDVLNIQYAIGKGFGYRETAYSMVVIECFCPLRTNTPHETPNYGPGQ